MLSRININEEYVENLYQKLLLRDRLSLAKAITLIESQNPKHEIYAEKLIEKCLPHSGHSLRIGITGTPGVGKSTFIESLGQLFLKNGKRLSVLTIDPTSPIHHGSILGDKSRMDILSNEPNAFIRSSPSKTVLGGTTDKTRETIMLSESAGYYITLIETVGIGQSETEILHMVDLLILLVLPGSGDEIQGIKRGIVEVADIIVVNKVDRFDKAIVNDTVNTFQFALHLKPIKKSGWASNVMPCSSLNHQGVENIYQSINTYFELITANGYLRENRKEQYINWLDQKIQSLVLQRIRAKMKNLPEVNGIRVRVENNEWSVHKGAREILKKIFITK